MRTGQWLVCLTCVLLAGCAGSRPARELSRETLAQVVEYEDQLRGMSRVLQAHYRSVAGGLGTDLGWMLRSSERTSQDIAARDAVDQLLADGYSDKAVRDYLAATVAAVEDDRARFEEARAKLVAAETEALAAATLEENTLKATRAKLEQLQREPSLRDRAAQLRPLIEAAVQAIRKGGTAEGEGS
jgi:phage shock protein A